MEAGAMPTRPSYAADSTDTAVGSTPTCNNVFTMLTTTSIISSRNLLAGRGCRYLLQAFVARSDRLSWQRTAIAVREARAGCCCSSPCAIRFDDHITLLALRLLLLRVRIGVNLINHHRRHSMTVVPAAVSAAHRMHDEPAVIAICYPVQTYVGY